MLSTFKTVLSNINLRLYTADKRGSGGALLLGEYYRDSAEEEEEEEEEGDGAAVASRETMADNS